MQNPSTLSPHGTLAIPQKAWWHLLLIPHLFIFLFIFPVHSTATVKTINAFREVILFPCLTFLHTFNFIYFYNFLSLFLISCPLTHHCPLPKPSTHAPSPLPLFSLFTSPIILINVSFYPTVHMFPHFTLFQWWSAKFCGTGTLQKWRP